MALLIEEEKYWQHPVFNAPLCFVGPILHERHVTKDGQVFYSPDWSRPEASQRVRLEVSHYYNMNHRERDLHI